MENVIPTWLNEPDDNLVYSDSNDSSNNNSHSNHHLDTEQEIDSLSDKESLNSVSDQFFCGKYSTKWSKFSIASTSRTRNHNIITYLPVTKKHGKNAKTLLEYFNIFF